jgi:hypothetical protein
MAGFGRFKLTDALPQQPGQDQFSELTGGSQAGSSPVRGRGKGKARGKLAGRKGKLPTGSDLAAEQVREARVSSQAKNAEASARDRMVDIGRGNQQAGRQRAK